VCETIGELTGLSTQIKWPNDVLIDGKKVCGILIEQRTTGQADFPLAAVVGVGLNVTQSPDFFEQANLPDATSLGIASRRVFDLAAVAKSLLQQLDPQYQRLIDGAEAALEAMWNARLGLLGKMVVAECIQHRHEGRLVSSAFAALEIENQDGSVVRLAPESIRTLRLLD
jgi:BirA family biotin operon repressor/biotin-[acetyl-CoA-carboxylase] ligase